MEKQKGISKNTFKVVKKRVWGKKVEKKKMKKKKRISKKIFKVVKK